MDTPEPSKKNVGRPATGRRADLAHTVRLDDSIFEVMAEVGKPLGFSAQRIFDMCLDHAIGTDPEKARKVIRVMIDSEIRRIMG